MEIAVQDGKLGLNSPKQTAPFVITVTRGIMSRTGRHAGNVDEGFCVKITGYGGPCEVTGERVLLATELLYARDRYDAAARNRIGGLGAYVNQKPAQTEVESAIERVKSALIAGQRHHQIRRVAAAE